jgi:hypothetical protein
MTGKLVAQEFVVPTVFAIVLAVALSIGAVYLIDNYLGLVDQAEVLPAVVGFADPRQ